MDAAKKEQLNKIAHLLAGGIILLHGVEKYESHPASSIYFLIAGAVFFAVAIFHHKLVRYIRSADVIFSIIEGLLAIIVAFDFIHGHTQYIQYAYFFAAAVYFVRAIIAYKTYDKHGLGRKKLNGNNS